MSEDEPKLSEEDERKLKKAAEERRLKEEKYKEKGFQKMSLAEYEKLRSKQQKKSRFNVPPYFKFILGTPFLIIFCVGIFFIPYILFMIATSPAETKTTTKKNTIASSIR